MLWQFFFFEHKTQPHDAYELFFDRFNSWVRAMSRMTKWDLRILSIRNEELRKCLGIDSLNEILGYRRMNWMEKVAKMSATLDDNRLPRKLDHGLNRDVRESDNVI